MGYVNPAPRTALRLASDPGSAELDPRALRLGQPCALRLIRTARWDPRAWLRAQKKRGDPKTAPSRFTLEGLQKFIKLVVTERTHLELRHHSELVAPE